MFRLAAAAALLLCALAAPSEAQKSKKSSSSSSGSSSGSSGGFNGLGDASLAPINGCLGASCPGQPNAGVENGAARPGTGGGRGSGSWKADFTTPPEVYSVYRSARFNGDSDGKGGDKKGSDSGGQTGGGGRGDGSGRDSGRDGGRASDSGGRVDSPSYGHGPGERVPGPTDHGPKATETPLVLSEDEARDNFESAVRAETARCGAEFCSLRDTATRKALKVRLKGVEEDSVVQVSSGVYRGRADYEDGQSRTHSAVVTIDMTGDLWRVTAVRFQEREKPAAPAKGAAKRKSS